MAKLAYAHRWVRCLCGFESHRLDLANNNMGNWKTWLSKGVPANVRNNGSWFESRLLFAKFGKVEQLAGSPDCRSGPFGACGFKSHLYHLGASLKSVGLKIYTVAKQWRRIVKDEVRSLNPDIAQYANWQSGKKGCDFVGSNPIWATILDYGKFLERT